MEIDLSLYEISVIPAVMFLIFILKQSGVPSRYLPIISVVIGVSAGLMLVGFNPQGILTGVLISAAAVGFHSGVKNTVVAKEKNSPQ